MKIRSDFVTNSSSSSFLLAYKDGLNEKQKEAIVNYCLEVFLGKKILTHDSSDEEIKKVSEEWYTVEDREEDVRDAMARGCDIYAGWVSFEPDSFGIADVYSGIWEVLKKYADRGTFLPIDDDLGY